MLDPAANCAHLPMPFTLVVPVMRLIFLVEDPYRDLAYPHLGIETARNAENTHLAN